jgi:hypothetical protein
MCSRKYLFDLPEKFPGLTVYDSKSVSGSWIYKTAYILRTKEKSLPRLIKLVFKAVKQKTLYFSCLVKINTNADSLCFDTQI